MWDSQIIPVEMVTNHNSLRIGHRGYKVVFNGERPYVYIWAKAKGCPVLATTVTLALVSTNPPSVIHGQVLPQGWDPSGQASSKHFSVN